MKKSIIFLAVLLLIGSIVTAQEEKVQMNKKFFLALSAGPAFPVGPFASTDTTSTTAGFAKTGVNVNAHFGYQVIENFGLASTFLYANHSLDIAKFGEGIGANHWQYYGVVIGPFVTIPVGEKATFNLKALAGITNSNSPSIKFNGTVIVKEDWSTAFAMQAGVDYRYYFGNEMYFLTNLDYNYMKPKFTLKVEGGEIPDLPRNSESAFQKISALNLNIGLGIKF
jgi:hypothetical protein